MQNAILPNLFWLSLEILGFFLTCIEIFSPERADKIQESFGKWRIKLDQKYDTDLYRRLWIQVFAWNSRLDYNDERDKHNEFSWFVLIITPFLSVIVFLVGLAFRFPLIYAGFVLLLGGLIVAMRHMELSWKIIYLLAPGRELGALGIMISSIGLIKGAVEIIIQLILY